MSTPYTLPQAAKIVAALKPAADAAGRNGAWVNLKNAHKAYIVFHVDQGNAATIALSIDQAKDVASTGAKAITNNVRIWANLDTATSDTLVRAADATSYTTDAALKQKQVVIEIDPASLDMANGYCCIRVNTGASNAANITEAQYFLMPLRQAGDPPPSAIV